MVSTRGIKLKFSENERVLCYEPDPTKAKVLYDSKVLDVVVAKDHRGRKTVEYLIHFQGWNSSWDRYVSEEYVLKDTPENRQLQKDLAEKSQLQLYKKGAYLYRRDRKKHSRKTSERAAPSSDDGSSGSPSRMDTDDGQGVTSSSDEDSSIDDENIPIELTTELREILEQDYYLINTKNKLVKLPAEPNVVNILESYWKHYATSQICDLNEKNHSRHRYPVNTTQTKRRPEDIQRNLTVCTEVLDGLRIYFDFTINDLLLYKPEQGQIKTSQAMYNAPFYSNKEEAQMKHELNYMDYINYPNNLSDDLSDYTQNGNKPLTRRRTLRSNKSLDSITNGNSEHVAKTKPSSSIETVNCEGSNSIVKSISWKLLPDYVYTQEPSPPCLVYGAIHLTRLFVKLPELLNAACVDEGKWKTILQHLDLFIDFLNDHREWFGEKCYVDK